jgi:hypothetical protein
MQKIIEFIGSPRLFDLFIYIAIVLSLVVIFVN